MFTEALRQFKTASILLLLCIVLTGIIYPYAVTAIAQLLFPWQANGSLIKSQDKVMGSLLIGQSFADMKYFWSRPSATSPFPYNAASSSGSNFGPSNPDFLKTVENRISQLKLANPSKNGLIPVDLVTSSASGLDPDITPQAAFFQVARIAQARNIPEVEIASLIQNHLKTRQFYILGEPRINVLELNLVLDNIPINKE
ncbi:MAG: potassium-transporting ATPase subunit KdpC [Gammaproteobacteria bacterium]